MNAGIAFISRKSRKTDVAWRYAIAVVLVVCCIGLAYVEIVVAPWFINEVVSMFPETTLLKEPSMFWEWAILLAVQATLLCTAALPRIQFVSATLVFGLAAFDCSLAISSSHTSLGVL